jgi:hypothetical protein
MPNSLIRLGAPGRGAEPGAGWGDVEGAGEPEPGVPPPWVGLAGRASGSGGWDFGTMYRPNVTPRAIENNPEAMTATMKRRATNSVLLTNVPPSIQRH